MAEKLEINSEINKKEKNKTEAYGILLLMLSVYLKNEDSYKDKLYKE